MGILDELFDRVRSHTAAPYNRLLGVSEETDRQRLHAVLLDGLDERATVFFDGVWTASLSMEHLRH